MLKVMWLMDTFTAPVASCKYQMNSGTASPAQCSASSFMLNFSYSHVLLPVCNTLKWPLAKEFQTGCVVHMCLDFTFGMKPTTMQNMGKFLAASFARTSFSSYKSLSHHNTVNLNTACVSSSLQAA